MNNRIDRLLFDLFRGDKRALSRVLTLVENETPEAPYILRRIYDRTGRAYRIGITGPPGAGKSTLINALAKELRRAGNRIGIIAVDPTSPLTGGALLGDRIRMSGALSDSDIFMRSMASRGGVGGLARATTQAVDVMDAFGFDIIIIETVGVGQLELDIDRVVDTTVVVLVPETGGNVQAMKAGLIEIADIFVINKADRSGAESLKNELYESLSLIPPTKNNTWELPINLTVALDGIGIKELSEAIFSHKAYLEKKGLLTKNRVIQKRIDIVQIVRQRFEARFWQNPNLQPFLEILSRLCAEGKMDPFSAAETFIRRTEVIGLKEDNHNG